MCTSLSRKQEVSGETGHEWSVKVAGEQVRSSDTFPKAFIAKWRLFFTVFKGLSCHIFSSWEHSRGGCSLLLFKAL